MHDLQKGYIRWWPHRVMDWDGDREQHWDIEFIRDWSDSQEEVNRKWGEHCKARKCIVDQYEDKPFHQEFTATMELDGFYRGRSAAGFTFKDETGREHTMRIKCVVDLLTNATLVKGKVRAVWAYAKQGANFSLKYIRDAE